MKRRRVSELLLLPVNQEINSCTRNNPKRKKAAARRPSLESFIVRKNVDNSSSNSSAAQLGEATETVLGLSQSTQQALKRIKGDDLDIGTVSTTAEELLNATAVPDVPDEPAVPDVPDEAAVLNFPDVPASAVDVAVPAVDASVPAVDAAAVSAVCAIPAAVDVAAPDASESSEGRKGLLECSDDENNLIVSLPTSDNDDEACDAADDAGAHKADKLGKAANNKSKNSNSNSYNNSRANISGNGNISDDDLDARKHRRSIHYGRRSFVVDENSADGGNRCVGDDSDSDDHNNRRMPILTAAQSIVARRTRGSVNVASESNYNFSSKRLQIREISGRTRKEAKKTSCHLQQRLLHSVVKDKYVKDKGDYVDVAFSQGYYGSGIIRTIINVYYESNREQHKRLWNDGAKEIQSDYHKILWLLCMSRKNEAKKISRRKSTVTAGESGEDLDQADKSDCGVSEELEDDGSPSVAASAAATSNSGRIMRRCRLKRSAVAPGELSVGTDSPTGIPLTTDLKSGMSRRITMNKPGDEATAADVAAGSDKGTDRRTRRKSTNALFRGSLKAAATSDEDKNDEAYSDSSFSSSSSSSDEELLPSLANSESDNDEASKHQQRKDKQRRKSDTGLQPKQQAKQREQKRRRRATIETSSFNSQTDGVKSNRRNNKNADGEEGKQENDEDFIECLKDDLIKKALRVNSNADEDLEDSKNQQQQSLLDDEQTKLIRELHGATTRGVKYEDTWDPSTNSLFWFSQARDLSSQISGQIVKDFRNAVADVVLAARSASTKEWEVLGSPIDVRPYKYSELLMRKNEAAVSTVKKGIRLAKLILHLPSLKTKRLKPLCSDVDKTKLIGQNVGRVTYDGLDQRDIEERRTAKLEALSNSESFKALTSDDAFLKTTTELNSILSEHRMISSAKLSKYCPADCCKYCSWKPPRLWFKISEEDKEKFDRMFLANEQQQQQQEEEPGDSNSSALEASSSSSRQSSSLSLLSKRNSSHRKLKIEQNKTTGSCNSGSSSEQQQFLLTQQQQQPKPCLTLMDFFACKKTSNSKEEATE